MVGVWLKKVRDKRHVPKNSSLPMVVTWKLSPRRKS